jgi:VanZ family protein
VAPQIQVSNIDKVYHATAYFIMTVLWYLFYYQRYLNKQTGQSFSWATIMSNWSRPIAIGAGIFCFLVGILVEFGQGFIAINRTMDFFDVLANLTGIIIALLVLNKAQNLFNT